MLDFKLRQKLAFRCMFLLLIPSKEKDMEHQLKNNNTTPVQGTRSFQKPENLFSLEKVPNTNATPRMLRHLT